MIEEEFYSGTYESRIAYVMVRHTVVRLNSRSCALSINVDKAAALAIFASSKKTFTMMKFAALALFATSVSAFAPATQLSRAATSLNAERSQALPFMNRPKLVSFVVFVSVE
jgi:hypothetical protein